MMDSSDSTTRPDSPRRLDLAIDALVEGRPVLMTADEPDDLELLATARVLHAVLPRFHPRFGFEELLARRLAAERVGAGPHADPSDARSAVTALSPRQSDTAPGSSHLDPRGSVRRRSLVAGGAIASGLSLVIPLAGAALVAWRRSRPSGGIG